MSKQPDYTILVVEDELPLQSAIRTKFENHGLNVATARSTQQALDYLNEFDSVDMIWLDHYLIGNGNGLDFVAELKKPEGKFNQIPIFVVSNSIDQQKISTYLQLGVDRYFTKTDCRLQQIIADVLQSLQSFSATRSKQ